MIQWAAIWGAILGAILYSREWEMAAVLGALLGAAFGATMRGAIRKEIAAQVARRHASGDTSPSAAARGATSPPQTDSSPPAAKVEAVRSAPASSVVAAASPAPSYAAAGPRAPQPPDPLDEALSRAVTAARDWLLGGNTIVRVGMLVLFVGLAFLAKYVVDHSLLPPELRLAGIAAAGIALFVFGTRLRQRRGDRLAYALTLQGGGVAVLYLAVFAAFRLYQFLPAEAAFALLVLVCAFSTTIALLQNTLPMAFIGFAGAFAAPLLASSGQGNHVVLFAYYLLLGLAIAVVAWFRAWRALNLLGFVATFGVATVWGVLQYQPDRFATTEPFLIGFFLIYVAASLLYAMRHSLAPRQAVDASLVFGTPLIAFGLQAALVRDIEYATAFSALVLGAFYLALGFWALRHVRSDNAVGRWLAECFLALGVGFATLAVPLALDARWTTAIWAAEGAAIYWMGRRQQRWLARATGLALQVLGAAAYLGGVVPMQAAPWPLANPGFIGAALLAGSALALAHWSREPAPDGGTRVLARAFARLEDGLSPLLFWVGFAWAYVALSQEIGRFTAGTSGVLAPVFAHEWHGKLRMLAWLLLAFAAHWLALPARARPWPIAATPAWFNLPIMFALALDGLQPARHAFGAGGWLIWPAALLLHLVMVRRLDAGAPQRLWSWIHSGGVWLLVLLAGDALLWLVQENQLLRTAWSSVILLASGSAMLLLLAQRDCHDPGSALRTRWPLAQFSEAYVWRAAAPLAAAVAAGALLVSLTSNGDATPLPYLPLFNPTDLAVALALATCGLWLMRIRQGEQAAAPVMQGPVVPAALLGIGFVALNTVWLRTVHHLAGVPWNAGSLFDSFLVQAGYSILWTLLALGLMVLAQRRMARPVWMGGAALLAFTLLKLLLIDLSNRGGGERIIVFIVVGVLMLAVGYFAPLPPHPKEEAEPSDAAAPATAAQGST